jgi:hypothetical protein
MSEKLAVTLDQRVQAAASILAGKTADADTITKYQAEVSRILNELGVTEVEHLDDAETTREGDLRHAFGGDRENPNPLWGQVKVVTWRLLLSALRGGKQATEALTSSRLELLKQSGIKVGVKDTPSSVLIDLYEPALAEDPVTRALKERFGDKPVVIFTPGTFDVDRQATKMYISDLAMGMPERDIVMTSNGPSKPVKIGVVPNQMVDEDPLFAKTPLSGGRSTVNFVDWGGVSLEARQFCRIVAEFGAIDPNNERASQELAATAIKGLAELRRFYVRPSVMFDERKAANELPSLRFSLDKNSRPNNPFGVRTNRGY